MRGLLMVALTASTQWTVRTSQGFDALCALNVLSGDPYYTGQYAGDTAMFDEPRYAAARGAARRLKTALKDEHGMIVSAFLTLVFSGGPDSTIDAVIESARNPQRLEASYRASAFWSDESWRFFLAARPDVLIALESMRDAGFSRDWARAFGADPAERARALAAELAKYDVSGEQQRLLGDSFRAERIEVILLRFARPHGIRIQGNRFLTDIGYPTAIVLRNAAHEPLHGAVDTRMLAARLAGDSLVASIVERHNRSYGYNTIEGYAEEDVTQALEQVVSDRLGFSAPAAARWQTGDDGMHVLAAALYDLMRERGFVATGGTFATWLERELTNGDLAPAEIARRARRVVGDSTVRKWRRASPGSTAPAAGRQTAATRAESAGT